MATTAQDIIDAAIASSLANDAGRSELSDNVAELLGVLNRRLRLIYALSGMPKATGGAGTGDYFAVTAPLTLAATPVDLPAAAFRHLFTRASDGRRVTVIARAHLEDGVAELPPALLVERNTAIGAGRAGDPLAGDVLNVYYTPLPDLLRAITDFIGATIRTDATTTAWPAQVGDPYLVTWLALYLARKAGDRDPAELSSLTSELTEASGIFGALVGVDAARLSQAERS
jgi:hypothetical protein